MPIFKDTPDFKASVPVMHRSVPWEEEISPLTDQAADAYVIPYIGKELYDELSTQVSGNALTTDNSALLVHLKKSVAYYTYMDMLTSHAAHMSSMGLQESLSSDGTSRPASNFVRNDARQQAANKADFYLDQTLLFLEKQVLSDGTKFPLWKNSEVYQDFFELFIWSTPQLTRWIKGIKSHRAMFSIRHNIRWVQEREIAPLLGEDFYNDLQTKIKERPTTALTSEYADLLSKIQPYLANQSMLESIPEHRIEIANGGIYFRTYDGPLGQVRQTATNEAIRHLMLHLKSKADGALATLKKFLSNNKDDYTLYEAPTIKSTESPHGPYAWKGQGGVHL